MSLGTEDQYRAVVNMDIFGITGPFPVNDDLSSEEGLRHMAGLFPFSSVTPVPTNTLIAKAKAGDIKLTMRGVVEL